jgi:hypothetical protein
MEPRLFTMIRKNDESHVSGTGRVLDGVVFHNGKVVICWRSEEKHGYPRSAFLILLKPLSLSTLILILLMKRKSCGYNASYD